MTGALAVVEWTPRHCRSWCWWSGIDAGDDPGGCRDRTCRNPRGERKYHSVACRLSASCPPLPIRAHGATTTGLNPRRARTTPVAHRMPPSTSRIPVRRTPSAIPSAPHRRHLVFGTAFGVSSPASADAHDYLEGTTQPRRTRQAFLPRADGPGGACMPGTSGTRVTDGDSHTSHPTCRDPIDTPSASRTAAAPAELVGGKAYRGGAAQQRRGART